MPAHDDLAILSDAARAAGDVARRYWRRAPETWDKPGGLGPVSEADMAVDAMLRDTLSAARPDYGWLSEETEDDAARLEADRVFIVDPIDGTRAFIEGSETWAHSLAVAEHGRITAAVVYLPVRGKLYAAHAGGGAYLNGERLRVSTRDEVDGASLLAAKANLDPWNWRDARAPVVKRSLRPSLAYRLSLVGEGRFDAMLTLRPTWEWDVAAGALIVEEAGGRVSDRRRNALCFNNPTARLDGLVAAGPDLHARLSERLL